jgi:hypothetical protein
MIAGSIAFGVAASVAAVTPSLEILVAAAFVIGLGMEVAVIPYVTLRSLVTPPELLGRVSALARMSSLGLQPLGMLLTGLLLDAGRGAGALLVIGGMVLAMTFAFGTTELRGARVETSSSLS